MRSGRFCEDVSLTKTHNTESLTRTGYRYLTNVKDLITVLHRLISQNRNWKVYFTHIVGFFQMIMYSFMQQLEPVVSPLRFKS